MKRATIFFLGCGRPAFVLWLVLALPGTAAQALTVVNQPWVRPAAAGHSTEAYMNLTSTEGVALVSARSGSVAAVTLHPPGNDARAAGELALPAGAVVALAPGNYRFSLRRLDKTIRLGDVVPLTLTLRGRDGVLQEISVDAVARLRSPVDDERLAHRHHH